MKFAFTTNCKKYVLDTETPISIYLKLREHFNQCILFEDTKESLVPNRLSYICFEPIAGISINGFQITKSLPDGTRITEKIISNNEVLPRLIDFLQIFLVTADGGHRPGMFGYITYDSVRYFEDIDIPLNELEAIPDIQYDLYRYTIVIDHLKSELSLVTLKREDEILANEPDIESIIKGNNLPVYPFKVTSKERNDCSSEVYLRNVEKGKLHCYKGDVFQVVLSRLFEIDFSGDDFNVYRALRSVNPSPYMFYFDYNNFRLFGSSPEAQLKVSNGTASIHPIAGTYRRSGDDKKDTIAAQQLKQDKKENAEHTMLVDLARNDLSRHYQDVTLTEYRKTEQYSHVIHMVSKVEGAHLIEQVHPLQILADTFPAGTLSGAPKHKAMNIIKKIEASQRGPYGGCIGFMAFDGTINKAIMIRSFLSKADTLYYRAGAGITAASVPENELEEINNKIDALRKALNIANTLQ